jgi:hypothetical protein
MDDWLIFQYHLNRAHPKSGLLRKSLHLGGATDPLGTREAKGGRRRVARPRRWSSWGKCVGGPPRQIREGTNSETRRRAASGEASDPMLPRKSSSERFEVPVPQTDAGGQVENTEAIERTLVKELGKLPP